MAELSLKHVYKRYPNGFEAVKDFNLDVADKEFIIFVGPSGCGKSTTLRMSVCGTLFKEVYDFQIMCLYGSCHSSESKKPYLIHQLLAVNVLHIHTTDLDAATLDIPESCNQ